MPCRPSLPLRYHLHEEQHYWNSDAGYSDDINDDTSLYHLCNWYVAACIDDGVWRRRYGEHEAK